MRLPAPRRKTKSRLAVAAVIAFVFCMVAFPAEVFSASKSGVNAWWNIVLPALLPFFISSELLMNYGVVRFVGVLLEPIMRPVFNLPGSGAFVMAVGYTSGFPISASLAGRLRKEKQCTRLEAERLMCFTNNASPLFMLVAVGVGMFESPRLGILLALCHYAVNLFLGLALRFYGTRDQEFRPRVETSGRLFQRAAAEMKKALDSDPRPFGGVLGDAVSTSMQKLLLIGGFMIVFSVIIKISVLTGMMAVLTKGIGLAARPLGLPPSIVEALGNGFFEITLGAKAASEAAAPFAQRAIATGMIMGWSGLSVLAQVGAMVSATDLRLGLFVATRFLHGVLSGLLAQALLLNQGILAWLAQPASITAFQWEGLSWTGTLLFSTRLCFYSVIFLTGLAALVCLGRSLSFVRLRL